MARLVVKGRGGGGASPETILHRGWAAGGVEAAAVLGKLVGSAVRWGEGLGGGVPVVVAGEALTGCGVPVVAVAEETEGPGGAYRFDGLRVFREAGGAGETVVELGPSREDEETLGFDLLWFGPVERYLLRGGLLLVDDLFSRARVPVDRRGLERLLVRGRRLEPGVLYGLDPSPSPGGPWIEVRRSLSLVAAPWADPGAVMPRREGVEAFETAADTFRLRFHGGVVYHGEVRELEAGWEIVFADEATPWRRLRMVREDDRLVWGAEPRGSLLDPALRARHAFDLFSDLVRLGQGA